MSNDKMKQDAYAAFVADDTKTGWCARSFFNAGWQAALERKPVQFKFPRHPDPESPWVIDFDFLMKVRDLIEDVDFTPCLEEVEEVLRAVEELYPTLSKPEVSQPAQPDYEALKCKYEGALESIRDHQKIGIELKAKIAELEFENSSIPEHQQIGKEIAAERDTLKLRVAELEVYKEKTKAAVLKYVEEIEIALRKASK